MKHLSLVAVLATLLVLAALIPTGAAPNIYGTGGLIEIPDDTIVPVGAISLGYHYVDGPGGSDENFNSFTAGIGILPNLDVSGGIESDGGTNAILNAKYRLAAERSDRPSITVGVVDAAAKVGRSDNPGLYIVFGKNLTAAAEEVAGGQSKPLRGYLGFGTGVLEGVFVGLDWTLAPKLSAMVEFLSSDQGFEGDSHLNAGIRYALTNQVRVDAGIVKSDLMLGISYNLAKL